MFFNQNLRKSGLGHKNHTPWASHQEWKEIPLKYLDKKVFLKPLWHNSAFCHPPSAKSPAGRGFVPMRSSLYSLRHPWFPIFASSQTYILDIFTLDKSWNAPWLSAYMLCASPLWTHIVPSRPFGRTARHPKTQFIPGTASAILGTGQIVRFLSLWLGGGTPLPPFLFDLHPPQNRQTDSFMLNNLLETEKSNRTGNMHTQHNSKEKTRDKHFLKLRSIDGSSIDIYPLSAEL